MSDTNTIDKFEKQNIFLCSDVLFMKKFRGKWIMLYYEFYSLEGLPPTQIKAIISVKNYPQNR